MKKLLSLVLVALMLLSFAACSGNGNGGQTANVTQEPTEEPANILTTTEWIDIVSGLELVFSSDNKIMVNEDTGTWSQDEDGTVQIKYYNEKTGSSIERSIDVVEKDGETLLRMLKGGKRDGKSATFAVVEFLAKEAANAKKASLTHNLGDMVSTDIFDYTLVSASLCYSANCAGYPMSSATGRCLVDLTFKITNKSRGSIRVGGSDSGAWDFKWNLIYNEKYYTIRTFDLNNNDGYYSSLHLYYWEKSNDGKSFSRTGYATEIMDAGKTLFFRVIGVVVMEPENVNDGFELMVNIPNSSSEQEYFFYQIN